MDVRKKIESKYKNISTIDVNHLAWIKISKEMGWNYGRKRL